MNVTGKTCKATCTQIKRQRLLLAQSHTDAITKTIQHIHIGKNVEKRIMAKC